MGLQATVDVVLTQLQQQVAVAPISAGKRFEAKASLKRASKRAGSKPILVGGKHDVSVKQREDFGRSREIHKRQNLVDVRRAGALQALETVPAADRLKLAALAKAGVFGGSVRAHYDFLKKIGNSSYGALATAEQLQKGVDLAKAQGLDLDAAW